MLRKNLALFVTSLLLLPLLLPLAKTSAQNAAMPDEAYIRGILQERVEKSRRNVGIVVGIVSSSGSKVISYGKPVVDSTLEVNGDTVFEIGSVTKAFTGLLLAEMAERGEVNLNDPVARYLPKTVKLPTRSGKEITLLDLATQTSGLPRLPGNMKPKDAANPYADYTVEQMYEFLGSYTLTRDIGEKYEYSNLGVGLLGHVLALKAGTDYETLVTKRILKPLGMEMSGVKLTPQMKAKLATGHDQGGRPVMNWDLLTLAGAGALRSTVNDMLKFMAANMGLTKTPLLAAMQKSHSLQRSTGIPDVSIGMGWHILNKFGTEIVWHNGGTGGYHSFIGFDRKKGVGVVVLANSNANIDDIGLHLLESKFPLAKYEPLKQRKAIKVDPKILEAYVGQYELAPNFIITITRDGDRLFAEATGQSKIEIFAESETEFFLTIVDAQMSFVRDDKGQVSHLILHQNGRSTRANKIK